MDCQTKKKNLDFCNCSYPSCPRKGFCCQCLQYHLPSRQVPACFFSAQGEKSYDRSIDNFIADYQRRK